MHGSRSARRRSLAVAGVLMLALAAPGGAQAADKVTITFANWASAANVT